MWKESSGGATTLHPVDYFPDVILLLLKGMPRDIEVQYRVIEPFGTQSARFHLVLLTLCAK